MPSQTPPLSPPHRVTRPYLVIGAGPSGLAAIRQLNQLGIDVECFEQAGELGGNWCYGSPQSSVCASTHLISSKRLTEFPDFRMPRAFPHYPSHRQVLEYLQAYADHYQLARQIRFGARVERVERVGDEWQVRVQGWEEIKRYAGVVVANGHHWHPFRPTWPGEFSGEILHAHDYKTPVVLRGKRVLVVGAGNSGCDIAVESAMHASQTALSMRRGYYFLPKYLCGAPLDRCGEQLQRWPMPEFCRRWITRILLYVAVGPPERYGLPRPDHPLMATHPIVNSQLPYFAGHGRVEIRADIDSFHGDTIRFVDGRRESYDIIVLATGYEVRFPFFAPEILDGESAASKLYLQAFHADYDNLCVLGLIQPNGGIWPLSDLQAQLFARLVVARQRGQRVAQQFDARRVQGRDRRNAHHYVDSVRHRFEVDYHKYGKEIRRHIRRFDRELHMRPDCD